MWDGIEATSFLTKHLYASLAVVHAAKITDDDARSDGRSDHDSVTVIEWLNGQAAETGQRGQGAWG